MTTMSHTTLGDRWIYDACNDPVYITALAAVIVTGGREADLFMVTQDGLVQEVNTTHVRGSGSSPMANVPDLSTSTVLRDGTATCLQGRVALTFLHAPTAAKSEEHALVLTGTWPGEDTPVLLAGINLAS